MSPITTPSTPTAEVEDEERYARQVGDVEVKKKLAVGINQFLDPIRERRGRLREPARLVGR